jgi:ABC-type branched-subunit amino acid transport system substrate-binding protein
MKKLLSSIGVVVMLVGCAPAPSPSPWSRPDQSAIDLSKRPSQTIPDSPDSAKPAETPQYTAIPEDGLDQPSEQIDGDEIQVSSLADILADYQTTGQGDKVTRDNDSVPSDKSEAKPRRPIVNVGLLLPLSGDDAELGQDLLTAAQMALTDIAEDNVTLVIGDTRGTVTGAEAAARDVIAEGAQLILGPVFSDHTRAIDRMVSSAGINMISFSTDWRLADRDTFIFGFLPFNQVDRVLSYAAMNGVQELGIFYPPTRYGRTVARRAESSVRYLGQTVVRDQSFSSDRANTSPIIRNFVDYDKRHQNLIKEIEAVESTKPVDKKRLKELEKLDVLGELPFDGLLLPFGGEDLKLTASVFDYYGAGPDQVQLLGTGIWEGAVTPPVEKALIGGWYAAPDPNLRQDFTQQFVDLTGDRPARIATLAYDAMALAAVLSYSGIEYNGRPAFNRSALMDPNGYAGVDGIFRFTRNSLVERGLAVMTITENGPTVIDSAPDRFVN